MNVGKPLPSWISSCRGRSEALLPSPPGPELLRGQYNMIYYNQILHPEELQRVFENVKRVTIATENFSEADARASAGRSGSPMGARPIRAASAPPK